MDHRQRGGDPRAAATRRKTIATATVLFGCTSRPRKCRACSAVATSNDDQLDASEVQAIEQGRMTERLTVSAAAAGDQRRSAGRSAYTATALTNPIAVSGHLMAATQATRHTAAA